MRKGANQLCGNGKRAAEQRNCFPHMNSTISLLFISEPSSNFCVCACWFVSELVSDDAHIKVGLDVPILYGHVSMMYIS